MKKILFSFIMLIALLTTVCFATENSIEFNDVLADDWFFEDIIYVQENGLMNGIGDEAFGPDLTTTRGMVITVLWRLDGEKICNYFMTFEDVESNQWYTEAIRWATSEKIVKGYDNVLFGTNDLITREQLATMLYRYAEYKGIDIEKLTENINTLSFDDIFEVSEWATEGMHFCLATGLIKGMTENKIEPKGLATRAQLAAIFRRLDENVLTEKESVKHTVTFDLGYDEKILETKEVLDGEKVVSPKSPSRSGYTFAGWYDEEKGGSKFDFDDEILSDVVIYAHWNKKNNGGGSSSTKKYTVTFELNGVGNSIASQIIIKGGKVTKPTDPTDINHTFAGWYTDSEYATEWNFETDTITADTTIYAKWTRTVKSILETNNEIPSSDSDNIPESAWVCNNGANLVLCKKLVNGDECLYIGSKNNDGIGYEMTDLSVLIDGNYVFAFESYGVLTCHMAEGKFTSADYDGTGTDYATLSGTYVPYVAVTGVSIEPVSLTLPVGEDGKFFVSIAPDNATNKNVTWSSSAPDVATVDNTGKVTAGAFGTATITVTTVDGSKTANCTVEVSETKTMADILDTNKDIPEVEDTTPPDENVWAGSSDSKKAFIGKLEGGKCFILKVGTENLGLLMKDEFERIDNDTYKRLESSGTFTAKMTDGKFTSLEFKGNDLSGQGSHNFDNFSDTYTAPSSIVKCTVTFDLNGQGGTAPDSQTIAKNCKANEPTPAPKATGYTFGGWYKEAGCTNAWDFDTDTVTADTPLYAKWTEWSTIADILATVVFPSVEYHSSPTTYEAPDNAWVCDNKKSVAFIVSAGESSILRLQNEKYNYITLATSVEQGNDNTFSAKNGQNTCTFIIDSGKLASLTYVNTSPNADNHTNNGIYTAPTTYTITITLGEHGSGDGHTFTSVPKGAKYIADESGKVTITTSDDVEIDSFTVSAMPGYRLYYWYIEEGQTSGQSLSGTIENDMTIQASFWEEP